MANAFTRSWDVTKATFHVMREDKELFIYPILSGITSLVFFVAMIFPSVLTLLFGGDTALGLLQYTLLFILYFGLAFIAIFFNTCVIYTAKTRFEGGNATLGTSFKFGLSRLGVIVQWALLSATVGLILRVLEGAARNIKGVGGIVVIILTKILGMAWAILTVFVVPSLVYKGNGPKEAIKDSVAVLKKTWGESLIRYFGLGLAQFTVVILGAIVLVPLFFIGVMNGAGVLAVVAFVLIILWIILVALIFGIANSVFNTALYVYGTTGKVPTGYAKEQLSDAFKPEKKGMFATQEKSDTKPADDQTPSR